MATSTARTRVINLRTDEARRALIDRAAEALGKDRTEFMLDAATREDEASRSATIIDGDLERGKELRNSLNLVEDGPRRARAIVDRAVG